MKRNVIILLLSLFFCVAVQAQSQSSDIPAMQKEILTSLRKLRLDWNNPSGKSRLLKSVNLQRLDSIIDQEHDPFSGELSLTKYEYIYNKTLAEVAKSTIYDSTAMQWDSSRIEYLYYNPEGLLALDSICIWDTTAAQWETYEKTVYSYSGGNNTETITLDWDSNSSQWENSMRHIYTYNENNQIVEAKDMFWMDSLWMDSNLAQYTYSSDSLLSEVIHLSKNDTVWENTQRDTYTYNADKLPEMLKMDTWDPATSAWKDYVKVELNYDEYYNLSSFVAYYFYYIWLEVSKGNYSYDNNYTKEQLVLPPIQEDVLFAIRHMLLNAEMYVKNAQQQWEEFISSSYFYSEHEYDGVAKIPSKDQFIYPNPFKDILFIKGAHPAEPLTIRIYNSEGQLVFLKIVEEGQIRLNVPTLPSGIYLYRIDAPSANFRGKLIKL